MSPVCQSEFKVINSQYQTKNTLKSPFTLLNELSSKCKFPIKMDLKTLYSKKNIPYFTCKLQIGSSLFCYTDTSKQRAKHGAALEFFNTIESKKHIEELTSLIKEIKLNYSFDLKNVLSIEKSECTRVNDESKQKNYDSDYKTDYEFLSNPICDLNVLSQKYNLNPPVYTFECINGPSHNPTYKCYLKFGQLNEIGIDKTKQGAKNNAAIKILKIIKNEDKTKKVQLTSTPVQNDNYKLLNDITLSDISIRNESPAKINDKIKYDVNTLPKNIQKPTPIKQSNIETSFESFKKSHKLFIRYLLERELNFNEKTNYERKLEFLSREQLFDVSYRELKWSDSDNQNIKKAVLCCITTNPIHVFFGIGNNFENAKNISAFNALKSIKIICNEL